MILVRPYCYVESLLWVGEGSHREPVSLPLAMELVNGRGRAPRLRVYRLARIFGKFLANGFLSEWLAIGESENDRINTGELWWAWVDLNHRPRPYQGRALAT